mmetsp:Transcript_100375/g.178394  ORF Transcript_100375/g.178394 Transcript_100375/m.178394 type:complete len:232 (+) Transcript_100375:63-758(+)
MRGLFFLLHTAVALAEADFVSVTLIRHGEKPAVGNGLTADGQHRATYLSHCMAKTGSRAFSEARPTHIWAPTPRPGKSHRSVDTVEPLAKVLSLTVDSECDKKDSQCFADQVGNLPAGSVVVAAWEHKAIPNLVRFLEVPHDGKFHSWPDHCDSKSWPEPTNLTGSACYDAMWQITFSSSQSSDESRVKAGKGGKGKWKAQSITSMHQGFGGSASSSCAQDLGASATVWFE